MPSSAADQDPSSLRTVVHKFGGTSVADAERYRHVAQLLLARDEDIQVTVVSAMKGVTDALIGLAGQASANQPEWRSRAAGRARGTNAGMAG
jgi:bifunctional aspartokinase / homoserine dehydrogenase 1